MKKKLLQNLVLLNEASLDSVKLKSEKEIIAKFIEIGVQILGADFAFSFIKNRRKFSLIYKTKSAPYTPAEPRSSGITQRAFESRQPQIVEDVLRQENIRQDAKAAMRSVAVVPISYKEDDYGTLDFCYFKTHRFTQEEITLFKLIGQSTAEAVTIFRLIEEKKEALKVREEFLALAAHELRTPITSIKVSGQYLFSATKDILDEKKREALRIINRQVGRLESLVEEVLFFSRYQNKRIALNLEECDLTELIKDSIKNIKTNIKSHQIEFEGEEDLWVRVDKDKIDQVFSNLVSNAIKYSPQGSSVFISVKEDKNQAVVSIRDQGPGIPQSQQKQIFERYYRGEERNVGGFGLGLFIVKSIVKRHKGKIWVSSKPGSGSNFFFSLPLAS